ncbi:MAG: hypothetical protein AAF514_12935 [Verrucomicrobiota bacterium]
MRFSFFLHLALLLAFFAPPGAGRVLADASLETLFPTKGALNSGKARVQLALIQLSRTEAVRLLAKDEGNSSKLAEEALALITADKASLIKTMAVETEEDRFATETDGGEKNLPIDYQPIARASDVQPDLPPGDPGDDAPTIMAQSLKQVKAKRKRFFVGSRIRIEPTLEDQERMFLTVDFEHHLSAPSTEVVLKGKLDEDRGDWQMAYPRFHRLLFRAAIPQIKSGQIAFVGSQDDVLAKTPDKSSYVAFIKVDWK